MVEIHVVQGEREMAADKSLGRFKLTGIPRHHEASPVQVLILMPRILLVTALDRTTGREQITIQGASTLSEAEVNRMIQEAEEYAESDRERKQRWRSALALSL